MTTRTPETEASYIASVLKDWDQLPDATLVRAAVVLRLEGDVSEDTLARRIKAGLFPAPIKQPGSRLNFWRVGVLREHQRRRQAAAEAAA